MLGAITSVNPNPIINPIAAQLVLRRNRKERAATGTELPGLLKRLPFEVNAVAGLLQGPDGTISAGKPEVKG